MGRLVGCVLLGAACGEAVPNEAGVHGDVPTWHQHVAPIVVPGCGSCHSPGEMMGAIDLTDPRVAAAWAPAVAGAVLERRMPPYPAGELAGCDPAPHFSNDRRLSEDAIDTVLAWVDAGAPLGDPATAAPIPEVPRRHLDRVDQVLRLPRPVNVPSRDAVEDLTVCVALDPRLSGPRFLEGVEVEPDAVDVVHHVRLNLAPRDLARQLDAQDGTADGRWPCHGRDLSRAIGGYTPGMDPIVFPQGSGMPVRVDEVLVAEIHYHSTVQAQVDQSAVMLAWADGVVARRAQLLKVDTPLTEAEGLVPGPGDRGQAEFRVPAGAEAHVEEVRFEVPPGEDGALHVYSVMGHMHQVGRSLSIGVERADGGPGPCLLGIPRWDFDWQLFYEVDAEAADGPVLYPGDVLVLRCTYDNSLGNPAVARMLEERGRTEPVDVGYGPGSDDEMCAMVLGVVPVYADGG